MTETDTKNAAAPACSLCTKSALDLGKDLELQTLIGHDSVSGIGWPYLRRVVRHGAEIHLCEIRRCKVIEHHVVKSSAEVREWYNRPAPTLATETFSPYRLRS